VTKKRQSRKVLATLGWKGRDGYVRVIEGAVRGEPRVVVEWRDDHGRRQQSSFPRNRQGIADARTLADTVHKELTGTTPAAVAGAAPALPVLTVRALFETYLVAHPVPAVWRPRTLVTIRERWGKFELFVDRETAVTAVTRETLDAFAGTLVAATHSVNQVKHYVQTVTRVFAFGVERDLIAPTKVTSYRAKFGRDAQRQRPTMTEFSGAERGKILAQLDPRDGRWWRAWVFVALVGYCGPRANAALQLRWDDVDFAGARVRWAPESDKMAHDRWQPVPKAVTEALWVAYGWRIARGYTGPFVFFSPNEKRQSADRPWTYAAAVARLHDAERLAGIAPVKWRGAHGFRRGIAGDVYEQTGSEKAAAEYIGDKSVRIVSDKYLLEREGRLRTIADQLEGRDEGGDDDGR
jgi:integrase